MSDKLAEQRAWDSLHKYITNLEQQLRAANTAAETEKNRAYFATKACRNITDGALKRLAEAGGVQELVICAKLSVVREKFLDDGMVIELAVILDAIGPLDDEG